MPVKRREKIKKELGMLTDKQLEKEDKQFFQLSDEERKKLGYKSVEDYHKGGGYEDAETNLCRLLSKQLKEVLLDQEVN